MNSPFPWSTPGSTYSTLKQSGKYGIQRAERMHIQRNGWSAPSSVFLQPRIKFAAGAWKREEKAEGRRRGRTRPRPRPTPPPRGHLAIPDMETAEGGSKKKLSRGRPNGNGGGESRKEMGNHGMLERQREIIFHRSRSLARSMR